MRHFAKNMITFLAALVMTYGHVGHTEAEPISIAITAQVRSVDDSSGVLGGAILVGDAITGTYTYESTTPDGNTLPTVGDYRHTTAPFGITLDVGGLTFKTDPNQVDFLVEIVNDHDNPSRDNYLLRSYNNLFDRSAPPDPLLPELPVMNHISWQLDDPTSAALSSEALPTAPPVLADWQSIFGLDISSTGPSGLFLIRADVTSAVVIPSPTPENRAPTIVPLGDQTSAEGDEVALQVVASDLDGDPLIFSATGLPSGLSIDPTTGTVAGTLPFIAAGVYLVTPCVSDENLVSCAGFTWTVVNTNQAPTIISLGDQTSAEGDEVALQVVASDLDGDPLIFSATGLPPGLSLDPITGTISGLLSCDAAGVYAVTLSVSDGVLSTSIVFIWMVVDACSVPPPPPPVPTTCGGKTITILGTPGEDVIHGTDGPDVIHGLAGNDVIYGGKGNDVICGGEGDDHLIGGAGSDFLLGGRGNDKLSGGDAGTQSHNKHGKPSAGTDRDRMNGGQGKDLCQNGSYSYQYRSCELRQR